MVLIKKGVAGLLQYGAELRIAACIKRKSLLACFNL